MFYLRFFFLPFIYSFFFFFFVVYLLVIFILYLLLAAPFRLSSSFSRGFFCLTTKTCRLTSRRLSAFHLFNLSRLFHVRIIIDLQSQSLFDLFKRHLTRNRPKYLKLILSNKIKILSIKMKGNFLFFFFHNLFSRR